MTDLVVVFSISCIVSLIVTLFVVLDKYRQGVEEQERKKLGLE